ncbi:hypothetical protein [Sandaracinus amylolyticus]|uniref:Uncharacterized protein n=1 Tax=Sandaracinus amylolyticus TaxID=927083 RepID=A0A0F6W9L7_9BACT|nr:hypothetical protein [Sandaracinus amylolyticus]AKF10905.1 hypothetical protein DB32_008054 [Sandaracinus amylolyticus]
MTSRVITLVLGGTLLGACATGSGGFSTGGRQTGSDAGTQPPPAIDAGTSDAITEVDAGEPIDAGEPSTGIDASIGIDASTPIDAGTDAGPPAMPDAGPPPRPCTPLPTTGTLTIDGTTSGGATWARPSAATCPATARATSVAGAVPYAEHVLCNTGAAGTFEVWVDSFVDTYMVVYDGDRMPADQLACRDADDDGAGFSQPLVTGLAIPAGGRVLVVVTGFADEDRGAYSLYAARE